MSLRYSFLFIPYLLALGLEGFPTLSYLVAWVGSFFIFYVTLSGAVKPLPGGRTLAQQLFRPIGFTQFVFAGYTACTSVFYFLSLHGYVYLSHNPLLVASPEDMALAAQAQQYYVLVHAAVSAGVLLLMDYRHSGEWQLRPDIDKAWFLLSVAVVALIATQLTYVLPGLGQVRGRLSTLALVASVLSLALSIIRGQRTLLVLNLGVYALNLVSALLSGWKEEIIVVFVLLAIFLYPAYKRQMTILAPVGLAALLVVLPTYNTIFRELAWSGDLEAQEAAEVALNQVRGGGIEDMRGTNWSFLTQRLSEIGMFTQYIDHVPERRPFYGTEIVKDGLLGVIPRAFWSEKPSLEALAMERVYESEVVSRQSTVSAKPQFVADAYLSFGALGVLLGGLLYGMMASLASRLAERWFGGYLLGSGLMYTAMFQILWRGSSIEYLVNALFWSFIFMSLLFWAGRATGFLVRRRVRAEVQA